MRLVFAGTPHAAVPTLLTLSAAHQVVAVITRPDATVGRKRVLTPSPVAVAASERGIPIIKTRSLDERTTADIAALHPDLGVVVAYGGLLKEPLLSVPRQGWINLHFSALPAWRGAAPVQRALMAGDKQLGISVFQLVAQLDAGDLFAQRFVPTPASATAGDMLPLLATDGADLVGEVVADLARGTAVARPQEGPVTLAPKLTDADGTLDFTRSLDHVFAIFRGVTPRPGAHTHIGGTRLKILAACPGADPGMTPGELALSSQSLLIGTATRPLAVQLLQPAGKSAMRPEDWWRGLRDQDSLRAGS